MKASHCCLAVLTLTTSFPQSLQADELRGRGDPQAMPRSIVMRRRRTSVCRSVMPPPNPFSFCPRHSLGCFAVVHKHHLHLSWATRCINQFDEDVKAFSLHLIMNWFIVLALCLMELSPWQWFTRHWHQPLHLSNTPSYSLPLFLSLSLPLLHIPPPPHTSLLYVPSWEPNDMLTDWWNIAPSSLHLSLAQWIPSALWHVQMEGLAGETEALAIAPVQALQLHRFPSGSSCCRALDSLEDRDPHWQGSVDLSYWFSWLHWKLLMKSWNICDSAFYLMIPRLPRWGTGFVSFQY